MTADELAMRLEKVQKSGKGWTARCPAHDDRAPSLSISEGSDGRVLLHCHAGCDTADIVTRLGLSESDLFADKPSSTREHSEAVYDYVDERGTLLFQKLRFAGKRFSQRAADGKPSLNGVRRVLYRLPEVVQAIAEERFVYIAEGEKDVDSLRRCGRVATCNPEGASESGSKWRQEYTDALRGAHVVILPDNDDPGRAHAKHVAAALSGVAASVRVLELPGLPVKGDVSDWLSAGHSVDELDELAFDSPCTALPSEPEPQRRFLSFADLIRIPRPDFLIEDIVTRKSVAVLFGPPGQCKSLIAQDWAMHMSSGGRRWMGKEVVGGSVVYIAAEGAQGIGARLLAWQKHHRCTISADLHSLTTAVPMLDDVEVNRLIADIRREVSNPLMVIVDTLSRSMVGEDENSQAAMSKFIAAADRIKDDTGATVLILHHTNASGDRERGSTVLRGACDSMFAVKMEDNRSVILSCEKQKDAAPFSKIPMQLLQVGDSVVLGITNGVRPMGLGPSQNETEVLRALHEGFTHAGATFSQWNEMLPKMPKASFNRARKYLLEQGYVDGDEGRRGARYTVTDKGFEHLVSFGITLVSTVCDTNVAVGITHCGGLEDPAGDTNGTGYGEAA